MTNPKPNNLYTLLQAVERKKQQQEEAETASEVKTSAPVEMTAPVIIEPPVEMTAPIKSRQEPLEKTAAVRIKAPTKSKGAVLLARDSPHLRAPYEVIDEVLPTLKPAPAIVLLRLYRLACGFHSWVCNVSVPKLAITCNISESLVRRSLKELVRRGYVRKIQEDLSNTNQNDRGLVLEVKLPRLAVSKLTGAVEMTAPVNSTAPVNLLGNKVNTQKENTQTQRGVGAGSKFTKEECRKYAEHLRSTGQGITNPGGYATAIHRTGEADELIAAFFNSPKITPSVDARQCPDCEGTGWFFPNGAGGGAAKCKHIRTEDRG